MIGDKLNPNEYIVYEKNNVPYSQFAAKCEFSKGIATFWYWRKNPFTNRYELKEHKIKDVAEVRLTIDAMIVD